MFMNILSRHLKMLEDEKADIEYLISRNNLRRYEYEERFKEVIQNIENIKEEIQMERIRKNE